jgi:hypothetical protein
VRQNYIIQLSIPDILKSMNILDINEQSLCGRELLFQSNHRSSDFENYWTSCSHSEAVSALHSVQQFNLSTTNQHDLSDATNSQRISVSVQTDENLALRSAFGSLVSHARSAARSWRVGRNQDINCNHDQDLFMSFPGLVKAQRAWRAWRARDAAAARRAASRANKAWAAMYDIGYRDDDLDTDDSDDDDTLDDDGHHDRSGQPYDNGQARGCSLRSAACGCPGRPSVLGRTVTALSKPFYSSPVR